MHEQTMDGYLRELTSGSAMRMEFVWDKTFRNPQFTASSRQEFSQESYGLNVIDAQTSFSLKEQEGYTGTLHIEVQALCQIKGPYHIIAEMYPIEVIREGLKTAIRQGLPVCQIQSYDDIEKYSLQVDVNAKRTYMQSRAFCTFIHKVTW